MHLSSSVLEIGEKSRFLVKLLMRGTFDVFIDSPAFLWIPPESTDFVEALWRRRVPVPVAYLGARLLLAKSNQGVGPPRAPCRKKGCDSPHG